MAEIYADIVALLGVIWRSIDPDYKAKYRTNIWDQFENQVRQAAYTNRMARFISTLGQQFNCTIGRNAEDRQLAAEILMNTEDRQMLRILRDETTLVILLLRNEYQQRREEWKKLEEWIEDDK